jgi:hypothetical protein
MSKPGEHKTVQARILAYAQEIGWTFVSREEAEERRAGFPTRRDGENAGRNARAPLSLFFDDLLDAKVREFNPRYAEAEGALLGQFRHLHTDIYGNREFPVRRGLNRRERRDRNEDVDGSIWRQTAVISSCRQFWHRLFQKLASACRHILEQAVQEMTPALEIP